MSPSGGRRHSQGAAAALAVAASIGLAACTGSAAPPSTTPSSSSARSSTSSSTWTPRPAQDGTPSTSPPPTSSTANAADALATQWLRGYLSRPRGNADTTWTAAISPISTPDLVQTVSRTNLVEISDWASWQVRSIDAGRDIPHPVSTPTRQVTAWIVTLTDGGAHTTQRGFIVYAYLDDGQRWLVAQVEHLYASKG